MKDLVLHTMQDFPVECQFFISYCSCVVNYIIVPFLHCFEDVVNKAKNPDFRS